jgi:hypothetical protein
MTGTEKKPRGRPRRYIGDRPNWTIRLEEKYGDQIRQIAEQSGRSISDVCSEQIVNSFRLKIMCDMLEEKEKTLTEELRDNRIAFKAAQSRMQEAEKRVEELTQRMEMMMRARSTKYRFGHPLKEKSK